MDTSKEYIKMCDCPEVQEQWREFAVIEERLVWADETSMDSHANLWLPRQEQIQKMINYCSTNFICGLYDWFIEPGGREDEFDSYEKLWLAFYMWEYHKKVWSSKEEKWMKK